MPQVEVTFDIDANGILHVTAKDKTTGKEQKIRIEASSGLSDTEIDRMVKDAEKHAEEDHKKREEIDARNRLDTMSYEVEKSSKEWEERLSEAHKTRLKEAIERARKALRAEDMTEIRAAQEELTKAYNEAGQSLYAQAGTAGSTGSEGSGGAPSGAPGEGQPAGAAAGKQEDVVEADYEIVDETKK
jgi:molecular chaperone DnaK